MLRRPSPSSGPLDLLRLEPRGDASSEASSDDLELPQCKIKRNYHCGRCPFYTQNPRVYLAHSRDVHFEKIRIYECQLCVYASRHQQKLLRHLKMVHGSQQSAAKTEPEPVPATVPDNSERMEDLVEEVEEVEDLQMDQKELDDCIVRVDDAEDVDKTFSADIIKSKGNFFSCDKCNYVTHIRTRFTKHVKYHSMPIIKCTMCEFRTPYKWNLDRHMKNHGGTGNFTCSMCNFTADIKQSLTVHEMNHHSAGYTSRRHNRVGASELVKEEEGSGDSSHSASDMGLQYAERELVSCNSDSNDAASTEGGQKEAQGTPSQQSPNNSADESRSQTHSRKAPRPIPQLIPLNTSTPNNKSSGEPPAKKFKESTESLEANADNRFENFPADITLIPVNSSTKEIAMKKKNESFFDRLKERLLTETGEEGSLICKNCGFESKCLSEHSVHEKTCTSQGNRIATNTNLQSLGSTRCQNCRHRCKSSADLFIHMQTCGKGKRFGDDKSAEVKNQDSNEATLPNQDKEIEPHPMENVVFVWNNINHDTNKFDTPLGININDDCTLPDQSRHYEIEAVDENEGMNLSPSQAVGKKVFKCPHCPFWASTASRFHVHIVGHLNKKPFECSLCKYKSNWRWDITKHIKLKSARDPEHNEAKVLMTDETGRRNYSKYNKFLAVSVLNENGENEFHFVDPNPMLVSEGAGMGSMEVDETFNDMDAMTMNGPFELQPLNLQTQYNEQKYDILDNRALHPDAKKPKKTLWKCKKCNYKDTSRDALLEHVREHSKLDGNTDDNKVTGTKKLENPPDPADLAYRCGHCFQLSNWKHVIQRHCRLKHDGVIKVISTVKPKPDGLTINDICSDNCPKCPYKTNDKKSLLAHLQQHKPSPQSIFKCFFCSYFVKDEHELTEHLLLHGVTDPEDYIAKAIGPKSPLPEFQGPVAITNTLSTKRHKCTECPYETNSKSQYMYHEQFHRLPADDESRYKCPECNYSVSKRHLLHQHLRVHGIVTKKSEEAELESSASNSNRIDIKMEINLEEIPFVWVSAKNEFHKMYKCRYCSYVNSQKCKIPNHENMHCITFENTEINLYKCLECKYTCDIAGRLAEHSKSHGEIYGRIYCPVEEGSPDEEQIAKLRKVIEAEKSNNPDEPSKDEDNANENKELKILYFCQKCPARYFSDSELRVHDKFHDLSFQNKCTSCPYSVPDENDLNAHNTVHSDEYNTKTKMLKFMHTTNMSHKDPLLELVHCPSSSEITWVVSNPKNNYNNFETHKRGSDTKHVPKQYYCKECPAKFFKSSALNYHAGLHGGEGDHKCKKCSYAVKNVGNLAKHELLHERENKPTCDYESGDDVDYKNIPLSGTDLFQRKTEAQKRVLTDKDKLLVKPNDHFPPVLQADPQFGYLMHGNPEFIYPTYLKNGRQKEKRYKCHKCPSAFEKREQYKIHVSLHGSKQRYKCELCDYSVKYYANYVQHMRKHQMNDEAQAERRKGNNGYVENEDQEEVKKQEGGDNIKLAIKTMPKTTPKSDFQQFSISDQQTLRLLQRRRSMNGSGKDAGPSETLPTKERKMHMCLLCPYVNQRQDSLTNHYRRHDDSDTLNSGTHKCSYCDLVVLQAHFLREHLKTHFNYQKNLTPECFVANEDVSFSITKTEEDNEPIDLKLDISNKNYSCSDDKIFVKIQTGELLVE